MKQSSRTTKLVANFPFYFSVNGFSNFCNSTQTTSQVNLTKTLLFWNILRSSGFFSIWEYTTTTTFQQKPCFLSYLLTRRTCLALHAHTYSTKNDNITAAPSCFSLYHIVFYSIMSSYSIRFQLLAGFVEKENVCRSVCRSAPENKT